MAVHGNYQAALHAFQAPEPVFEADDHAGVSYLARDEILCLLHLGRGPEGLARLQPLGPRDIDEKERVNLTVALAVAADDEAALQSALAARVRYDRVAAAASSAVARQALTSPVAPSDVHTADLLMEIACDFGERYDNDVLHLLGSEVIRRGCTDDELLYNYADTLWSNGNFREALTLFQQLQHSAHNADYRERSAGKVYDLENAIYQLTRNRTVEQAEEATKSDRREHFFRSSW